MSVNIKEISGEKETQFLNTIENADYGVEEVGGPLAKHISKILDEKIEVLRKGEPNIEAKKPVYSM